MSAFICGFEVTESVCIDDEWHAGGHVMVDRAEIDALVSS